MGIVSKLKITGISSKITVWFLVMTVSPLIIFAALVYGYFTEVIKEEKLRNLEVIVDSRILQFQEDLKEKESYTIALSFSDATRNSVEEINTVFKQFGINSVEYEQKYNQKLEMFTSYQGLEGYTDAFLINRLGEVIFSLKKAEELGTSLKTGFFKETELAKVFDRTNTLLETSMSRFKHYLPSQQPKIFIAAPIFKDQGTLIGTIVLQYDLDEIYSYIQDYASLGKTGETIVATKENSEIVLISPLRNDRWSAFKTKVKFRKNKIELPIESAVHGKKGKGQTIDYRGEEILAAWRYMPELRWGVVVKIDAEEAFSVMKTVRNLLLILLGLAILVAAVISLFLSESITVPIRHLSESAADVAMGDLNKKIETSSSDDEIIVLTNSFNGMIENLREALDDIKEKNTKITTALDKTEMQNVQLKAVKTAMFNIVDDLEELKKELEDKNEKLLELDLLKNNFVSMVSHELRTPVTIMRGSAELLRDGVVGEMSESQKDLVIDIVKSADRLNHIINDLLDIAKLESGKIELNKKEIEVKEFLSECIKEFHSKAEDKNIQLRYMKRIETEKNISADPERLIQIMTNFLSNAIKFTPAGGMITLSTEILQEGIKILVEDTGVGLSEENIGTLFDKFTQFGKIQGSGEKGTGLGMAITKELVELHGSEVFVESEKDKGTTFSFILPYYINS